MNLEFFEVTNQVEARATRRRFRAEVATLEEMGFRSLFVVEERTRHPLVLLSLPLMWAKRERCHVGADLSVRVRSPLLIDQDGTTIALVFAMGVKFYSEFSDGTVLITGNFSSHLQGEWPDRQLYKYGAARMGIREAYREHRAHQEGLSAEKRTLRRDASLAAYERISRREAA